MHREQRGLPTHCSHDMPSYYARRNHGKLLMWQEQVDDWCRRIARDKQLVQVSETECAQIPVAMRGVMHGTVPGLNKYLDHYVSALRRFDEWHGLRNRQTVVSLQALPVGPYSERLPTYVAEGADPTSNQRFRNPDDCFDCQGQAFQIDATSPETSILREPLFARPAVTCPSDNPFANVQSYATTFFGAAAAIARTAKSALLLRTSLTGEQPTPRAAQELARSLCARFHDQSAPPPLHPLDYRFAVAICVLLHVCFPYKQGNREPIVRWAYAFAAGASRKHPECNLLALERMRRASGDEREANAISEALSWWWRFARERNGAWDAIAPLLERILERDGSFDNSLADIDAMANDFETAVRGVWCVHSADGVHAPTAPSILEGVLTPRHVESGHLNPVFVGSTDETTGVRKPQRASCIGTMPMAFQQMLALLTATDALEKQVAQAYVNEGACAYRSSAAPDVLTSNGKPRSAKATSCVGVEGDHAAFGTRADRLESCAKQREAWKLNLELVFDLLTTVSTPLPSNDRAQGDVANFNKMKSLMHEARRAGVLTKQELEAAALFKRATRGALGLS